MVRQLLLNCCLMCACSRVHTVWVHTQKDRSSTSEGQHSSAAVTDGQIHPLEGDTPLHACSLKMLSVPLN